ncbi:unnamed protein product [Orchesella dallaii]|uniref:Proteasomal ATPase-associated factor 1 n=1 Tax=Orchesella dallaii TaxID=48710 RepID=A0ABP1QQP0_9HEXA
MSETEGVTSLVKIPFFGLQCDWDDSFRRPNGTAWISVRYHGQEKSTHGDLVCRKKDPLQVEALVEGEPFEVIPKRTTSRFVSVKDSGTRCECSFLAPDAAFNKIHNKSVVSLDVTEGGLGVSVCGNNQLKVWETSTGCVRRTFEGHRADVYSCKFFPSGLVVHSCGADLAIKIWSAEDGSCPVTLKGHTAAIQDCLSVDRGRNIISVSKDGKARLWDVGESKCLATLIDCSAPINGCCLTSPTAIPLGNPVEGMSEREVGTVGKLLLLVREDSKVTGVSVASREEVFTVSLPSPGNCVIATGPNTFAVGCQGGEIVMHDRRKPSAAVRQIVSATQTPILDLMMHPRSPNPNRPGVDEFNRSFWAAKSDGTCVLVNPVFTPEKPTKFVQLTGPDCDPVYQVKHDGNYIYTACRDGLIRKYSIGLISKILE